MHADLEGFTLYAFLGRDEVSGDVVGLKQARVPAGVVPLVVTAGHRDRLDSVGIRRQLQGQADAFGRTIRLVRFVAVEEVMTIEPRASREPQESTDHGR
jgi:hypothetical protein